MKRSWYLANDTQLFLILPFMTKLHSVNRRVAWAVLTLLVLSAIGLRAGLSAGYNLQQCLDITSPTYALDLARDQTVVYNKPFVAGVGIFFFFLFFNF
jgi:hypothetical protein